MTQEEHWKLAYRQLKEKTAKESAEADARHRVKYDELEKEYRALADKMRRKESKADKVISQAEALLHFIHDDIRSSLAEDTVVRIEDTLQAIKEYYFGPQNKKQ